MNTMRSPSELQERVLAENVRAQLAEDVENALARGWRANDLRAYFKRQGVMPGDATSGAKGLPISESSFDALSGIYVRGGIPQWPYEPSAIGIRSHLDWLVEPTPFDDALVEIAFDEENTSDIKHARLFEWGEFDQAVAFAMERNLAGRNVYVGAALRSPSASRNKALYWRGLLCRDGHPRRHRPGLRCHESSDGRSLRGRVGCNDWPHTGAPQSALGTAARALRRSRCLWQSLRQLGHACRC